MNAPEAVEAIKRCGPALASLRVAMGDGTEKAVAIPKAGNRWARITATLGSMPWVSVECLDAEGRVLGVIEAEEPEDDLEDDDEGGDRRIARILQEVMRSTMKETRLMFDAQLKGQAELLGAMTEGMRHLSESYKMALQVQQSTLMAAAPGASETEAPEVMRMMQMAMMMMANNNSGSAQLPPKKDG
jgi:hypothetical protein